MLPRSWNGIVPCCLSCQGLLGAGKCKIIRRTGLLARAITIFRHWMVCALRLPCCRIASPLYGPAIAIMMYLIARYDTFCSRVFSNSILVRYGEVSYSIYLLHEILPSAFSRLGLSPLDQWSLWLMWSGSLLLLAIISRVSYLYIERPARLVIRARLAQKFVQHARYV